MGLAWKMLSDSESMGGLTRSGSANPAGLFPGSPGSAVFQQHQMVLCYF
jgi:hypothetical protein